MIFINSLALLLFLITLLNIFTVKTLKANSKANFTFDLLIPMRNEEKNVDPLITNLSGQGGNIFALNDNSTDDTLASLNKYEKQISIINGRELPSGWLGKNFACHQLAISSKSEYLVFIDADVRLQPNAVNTAIEYMVKRNWDYISPYPRQRTSGLIQLLIQPLLQWSWFASIPFHFAYRFPQKSMAVANGQFFIVTRSAYLASGGHKEIKSEVLDDIELARALIGAGFKGGPVDGSKIAECHMYKSDIDLINGYGKSLWRAFGGTLGTIFALLLLAATAAPFVYLTIGALYMTASRFLVAFKVRSNPISALLHPFAMLALVFLIIYSNYLHRMGRLTWKERPINVENVI